MSKVQRYSLARRRPDCIEKDMFTRLSEPSRVFSAEALHRMKIRATSPSIVTGNVTSLGLRHLFASLCFYFPLVQYHKENCSCIDLHNVQTALTQKLSVSQNNHRIIMII